MLVVIATCCLKGCGPLHFPWQFVRLAPSLVQRAPNLRRFNTMMVWKWYTCTRNCTSNLEFWSFPGLVVCDRTLSCDTGRWQWVQLLGSHAITGVNSQCVLDIVCVFFLKILFIFRQRVREEERGRETLLCGCLSHSPYWGPGPKPRHVPWSGNRTRDPLVHRPVLNPLSYTSQGWILCFVFSHKLHEIFNTLL